mmetsp:Transcript_104840/g.190775  ORF Transcript_104840/g.190775 Transcript_104840/m.190775 type:complete len:101 (-) Transcript_104840:300-602(-)
MHLQLIASGIRELAVGLPFSDGSSLCRMRPRRDVRRCRNDQWHLLHLSDTWLPIPGSCCLQHYAHGGKNCKSCATSDIVPSYTAPRREYVNGRMTSHLAS